MLYFFYDFKCERLKLEEFIIDFKLHLAMKVFRKRPVCRWYNELKRGRLRLRDEERSGRPLTAVISF